ncbi:GGDEF domain-containing protein [Herbaspirillum sp. HC18]|nr:GGDEF domain-containing protein [Herbaspirillum sp. HC18]
MSVRTLWIATRNTPGMDCGIIDPRSAHAPPPDASMDKLQRPDLIAKREREDALTAYRHRVISSLAIVAAVFIIPFSINNFLQGRITLGVGLLFALFILGIDAIAIYLQRKPPIPFGLLIIPAIGGTALAVETQGFYAALWSYPAVLLFHFTMSRLQANVYSVLQLVAASLLVLDRADPDIALRFFVTLTLTVILINIALNIIDDLHDRLVEQTILDPLTGAFNRRHMDTCLGYMIERSRRTGAPSALLLIDIDHFKRINDEFGHAAGDRVLKSLVEVIGHRTRKLDMLFRIGGEEFLLLLPDTVESDAVTVADDIRETVSTSLLLPDWELTLSIGVAELHPGESTDAWLKHADDAMYVAKNTGRDRSVRRSGLLFAQGR